jgi:glycosyltransferase involved in cell wall biosynthesis
MITTDWPKISVITPSYKRGDLIEDTLLSVLTQCYPNLEYIVIDGAGDHTDKILKKYDKQLAYWCSQPDHGQYDALNRGFSIATGDILCWLNADDMFLPRSLFIVAEIFKKFDHVQWVSTLKPGYWDANSYLLNVGRTPGFSKQAFLDGCFLPITRWRGSWIQQESTFFRREMWTKSGSKIPDYHLAGDFALWCEFYRHADLYGVDYPLAGFRCITGQRSEAKSEYIREAESALAILREQHNWSDAWRYKVRSFRVPHVPTVKDVIASRIGYSGKKIINKDPKRKGAEWEIVGYRWLP